MFRDSNDTVTSYSSSTAVPLRSSEERYATLLLTDNALVRAGLTHILSNTCFVMMDAPAAVPDLCLIDASGSSERLLEAVATVKSKHPVCKVTLIDSGNDPSFVQKAISAGVDGFCAATSAREVLMKSLELIMLGEKVLPSALIQTLLNQLGGTASPAHLLVGDNPPDPRVHKLSPREKVILQSIMSGDANKVIARKLDVAEATVKVHVKAILRKVGAANRTQAAMWAAGHLTHVHQPSLTDVRDAPLSS
jgi:DNA-binding NarL/FixJ family response regulator